MSSKQLLNPRVSTMRGLKVRYVQVTTLKPYNQNPRTHSKKQIRQIADSIRAFGFTNPILIHPDGAIIAGHGRVEAAKLLGMEQVPTIRLDDLTAEQVRAYIIADNKLAENAGWDRELLAIELQSLTELEIDFDVTITGFETAEIDLLIEDLDPSGNDVEDDRIPEVETGGAAVSVAEDLWQLGHHRLLCGDATDPNSFERLMQGRTAQMVFVDPPYNVAIDGHVCGLGRTKHANFAMASGEMSSEEFTRFLEVVLHNLTANSADGSIHFVFMDWRHMGELTTAGRSAYSEQKI